MSLAPEKGVFLHPSKTVSPFFRNSLFANTAKFSGAELETLASEAALLAFERDRPQQVSLGDLEECRQTITPLAIQDEAAVGRPTAVYTVGKVVKFWDMTEHSYSKSVATP